MTALLGVRCAVFTLIDFQYRFLPHHRIVDDHLYTVLFYRPA